MNIGTKFLTKMLANRFQQYVKRIIHQIRIEFIPGMQDWSNSRTSIEIILYFSRLKNKSHMFISINIEKVYDKI